MCAVSYPEDIKKLRKLRSGAVVPLQLDAHDRLVERIARAAMAKKSPHVKRFLTKLRADVDEESGAGLWLLLPLIM